jgi:copper(I)-binding protein
MFRTGNLIFFAALALMLAACASAGDQDLQVTDIWARPGLADGNSAIFFVIENPGSDDTLLAASSDVAAAVELHKTSMQDGVMKMEHQLSVPVPKGETVFKPGDLHVMLIGLNEDLVVGDEFGLTLTFSSAGEKTLNVSVREP